MSLPYDESQAVRFGLGCNDVYKESGAAIDPGMIAVHSQREAWDVYVGGMSWDASYTKHINEFRAVYHLPPVPGPGPGPDPGPTPTPIPPLDLSKVRVEKSDPACLKFPVTAKLKTIGVVPGGLVLIADGTEHWPKVAIDEFAPSQSGTLWVFEFIKTSSNPNGIWTATGAERLKPEQMTGSVKPEPKDLGAWIGGQVPGDGWLYNKSDWPTMNLYNPKPGELVYFMIVAGNTRMANDTPVKERSEPVGFYWPDAVGSYPVGTTK